jgi:hypothetical protein
MLKNEEWQHLCARFEEAKESRDAAFAPVLTKQIAVAEGSQEDPTDEELGRLEQTEQDLEKVRLDMDAFIAKTIAHSM